MNAINNTASNVAVSNTDSELPTVKAIEFGKYAMREIVKGLRATEKGNRTNVILHVGQVVETIARTMRNDRTNGTDSIGSIQNGKAVPPGVERALRDTLREVIVAMIKAGDAPYLNCARDIARIKAMPRDTAPQRTLWDYQARKLADSTLFMDGAAVEKPKGKYLPESLKDAKSKEFVESLKVLRNFTNKIVSFLWAHHADTFRNYAFRDETGETFSPLSAEDVSNIAVQIETLTGGAKLGEFFAKPKAAPSEKTATDKLLESFAKLSAEDRATFLRDANNKHAELQEVARNATLAVNGADALDDFDDLIEDEAIAA